MSRWLIEKSGTGIEKSGTGIEKSGTGIEKSGTGIEKSGTGIEKSGTGLRKTFLCCTLAAIAFASQVNASEQYDPEGTLTIVAGDSNIAISWIFEGSVFSGVSTLNGTVSNLFLTEIGFPKDSHTEIAGGGSGSAKEIAGGGSGSSKQIAGGGSGSSTEIAGGGSGSTVNIAGGGSGASIEIAGGGSGSNTEIAGGGSGSNILIANGGSGGEAIAITLPDGTGLQMEVTLGCDTATVAVLDATGAEVVVFANHPVIGAAASAYCMDDRGGFDDGFGLEPTFGSGWDLQ